MYTIERILWTVYLTNIVPKAYSPTCCSLGNDNDWIVTDYERSSLIYLTLNE